MNYPVGVKQYGTPDDYQWNRGIKKTPDLVKRKVLCVLLNATRAEPPHLVDIGVLNEQFVEIWYTIEPYAQDNAEVVAEKGIQGWDIKFKLFRTFPWSRISDANINSVNYERANNDEWQWRIHKTNLENSEDVYIRQNKGIYWR